MITYTEKGIWLHDAIHDAGHTLQQVGQDWIADDEAAVQAIIDSFDPTPHSAAEQKARIDEAAGAARARYITVQPGQEATYQRKEQEARQYLADGTIGPMLQAEADATGMAVADLANQIVATADQWTQLAAAIEAKRMSAKRAIDAETDWTKHKAIADAAIAYLEAI